MRIAIRIALAGAVAATMALGGLAGGSNASAAQRATIVTAKGSCSASSTWKLTLKYDKSKVESDFELHTPAGGQSWHTIMTDNGTGFYDRSKLTKPNGDVTFNERTANQSGPDLIVATATDASTGETCQGSATL